MRKWLFLLIALLLAGCGLGRTPTPSPTPRPTVTPTPAPRYYPTLDASMRQELLYRIQKPKIYYREITDPDGTKYELFGLMVISSGKTDTIQVDKYDVDVVWVYERNLGATYYPLVIGVQDGQSYTPYYFGYDGEPNRQAYLAYLEEHGILERGRKLFPTVSDQSGGYVSLYKKIEWDKCGDSTYCRLGKYMQDTYGLDGKVIGQSIGLDPIPEGWVLAWMWDAATEENSDPAFIKVDLPGGEQ